METPSETFARAAACSIIGGISVCIFCNSIWPMLVVYVTLAALWQLVVILEE